MRARRPSSLSPLQRRRAPPVSASGRTRSSIERSRQRDRPQRAGRCGRRCQVAFAGAATAKPADRADAREQTSTSATGFTARCPALERCPRSIATSGHSSTRPSASEPAPSDRFRRGAETDQHPWIVGRPVAAVGPGSPPDRRAVARTHGDPRAQHVAAACLAHQPQAQPVVPVADVVHQQADAARCRCRRARPRRRRCRCRRTPRRGPPPTARTPRPPGRSRPRSGRCAGCGTAASAGRRETAPSASPSSATIVPLTARMSSQPSLSKSNHAVPQPVYGRLDGPRPEAALSVAEASRTRR